MTRGEEIGLEVDVQVASTSFVGYYRDTEKGRAGESQVNF